MKNLSKCIAFSGLSLSVTSAFTQVPRGESSESGEALGALWIFAGIVIYAGFKRSKKEGMKTLAFFSSLAVIYAIFPAIGAAIIGILGLIFAIGLFISMF